MKFEDLLKSEALLQLGSIGDDGSGRLRAVICFGGHRPLPRDIMGKHADEIAKTPIEYTAAPYLELIWERYFTFMVRDEGAAAFRKEEEFFGHSVRIFEKSWLLSVVPELSNGLHEIPGVREGLKHFGVYALDQIVDVLAYEAPLIRDLGHRGLEPKEA
jgi:hypothetical protein